MPKSDSDTHLVLLSKSNLMLKGTSSAQAQDWQLPGEYTYSDENPEGARSGG